MSEKNTIKIAVADDHTILRKGVIELINAFGDFEVILDATNGRELITKIQQSAVLPDVCLIDINMPVLNGYETAEELRKTWPALKILALSMYNAEYTIIRMLASGANGYILKEADPIALREALIGVYENEYYYSEQLSGKMVHTLLEGKKLKMHITEKELQFLKHCCSELNYKEIAEKMFLSPRTVEGYRDALFEKLNIKTRTGLVIFALEMGLNQNS